MLGSLRNKVVVITGASAGVGMAAAREFARNGADVALLARNCEALDKARVGLGLELKEANAQRFAV